MLPANCHGLASVAAPAGSAESNASAAIATNAEIRTNGLGDMAFLLIELSIIRAGAPRSTAARRCRPSLYERGT
jgi:hypothetical protein